MGLFDVYAHNKPCPPPIAANNWNRPMHINGLAVKGLDEPNQFPSSTSSVHDLVCNLVAGPPYAKDQATVDWIRSTHSPRPFKKWVAELTGLKA